MKLLPMASGQAAERGSVGEAWPCGFKQWGGTRKARTGRRLHGRTYDEMPVSLPHGQADSPTGALGRPVLALV